MENKDKTIESLRAQIAALPVSANGKRMGITEEMRREAAQIQFRSGISLANVSAQIGVCESVFRKWCHRYQDSSGGGAAANAFKKLTLDSATQGLDRGSSGIVVEGPQGLKITGMSVSELASFWRQLC